MDSMDGMDSEGEALHLRREAGVVNGARAAGAGHVTRWALASLGGRSYGRDGLNGLDGLGGRSAAPDEQISTMYGIILWWVFKFLQSTSN